MLRFFPFTSTATQNPSTSDPVDTDQGSTSLDTTLPESADVVNSCRCCGTLVKFPETVTKYKCLVCQSTLQVQSSAGDQSKSRVSPADGVSYSLIKGKIKECEASERGLRTYHDIYRPLEDLIRQKFSDLEILNNSFLRANSKKKKSLKNLSIKEVQDTFNAIVSLPTSRPYYLLLLTVNDLLRRPTSDLSKPEDLVWLLILFELPTLSDCLYHNRVASNTTHRSKLDTPEVKAISYEIIKRLIGYLASSEASTVEQLARKFSSFTVENFGFKVQLLNLYITFHLTRLVNAHYEDSNQGNRSPDYSEYSESSKLNSATPPPSSSSRPMSPSARRFMRLPVSFQTGFISWAELSHSRASTGPKPNEFKLRVMHYGSEWHIRTAARLLSIFYIANRDKLPHYAFYNAVVDFISVRQDYETWQSSFVKKDTNKLIYDILSAASTNIIDLTSQPAKKTPQFTFCNYPFLLTLGMKISVLEYEAKKSMERKAEETFIKALDRRKAMDINLRIQVRRAHIANDSLKCIKLLAEDELKKSLKVEFVGEPGIDVGGLKKEWFALIIKELFSLDNGLFYYEEDSHACWFTPEPLELSLELYHMVGIVLGLAIYNSTILDLRFPLAVYKKLINKKIRFEDYKEMCPTTAKGLQSLLDYTGDVEDFELYFDTTFKNMFGDKVSRELVPGGANIRVTNENKKQYVSQWVDFYMNKSISTQFESFYRGFHKVIGGNALSLFSAKEIEMIICGNCETSIDCDSFKAITKYSGWLSTQDALESNVVRWFWNWFSDLSFDKQKRFLAFVTGSDRIPATGVSTMSFKITRIRCFGNVTRLPVAHTCFNELCLYEYATEEEFVSKLNMSIYESEGFGLR